MGLARGFASDLLASAPKIHIQVLLLLLQAVFWHQFLDAACRWFKKWSRALAMHKQWVALNTRSFAGLGIRPNSFSEEETAACMLLAILCQHTIGGALCLPAVLGFAPPRPPRGPDGSRMGAARFRAASMDDEVRPRLQPPTESARGDGLHRHTPRHGPAHGGTDEPLLWE